MTSPLLASLLRAVGYDPAARRARRDAIAEATPHENDLLDLAARYSMTGRPRLWALMQAMRHVARTKVDGDIVECGVWKGGNLILCGLLAKELKLDKRIWGYDTFQGMSEPTDADFSLGKNEPARDKWRKLEKGGFNEWSYAPHDDVSRNFREHVGTANLVLVKGKVEATLERPENLPAQIAILRLDTDWYESTKKELTVLFPRLQRGGVLIVDDYGHWAGSKKAVDEYFADNPIWLQRIDYSSRLYIKA